MYKSSRRRSETILDLSRFNCILVNQNKSEEKEHREMAKAQMVEQIFEFFRSGEKVKLLRLGVPETIVVAVVAKES